MNRIHCSRPPLTHRYDIGVISRAPGYNLTIYTNAGISAAFCIPSDEPLPTSYLEPYEGSARMRLASDVSDGLARDLIILTGPAHYMRAPSDRVVILAHHEPGLKVMTNQDVAQLIASFAVGGKNDRGDKVFNALAYAKLAHGEQKRKWTDEPYIVHPIAVMMMVDEHMRAQWHKDSALSSGYREDILCAALLHDVLEDTSAPLAEITEHFGARVSFMVLGLTNTAKREDGNRAKRTAINIAHLAKQDRWTQAIKCADILDNVPSIRLHDPEFAKVYDREKLALSEVLTKAPEDLRQSVRLLLSDVTP